jgi:SAM-dependent methyltransferase
MSEHTPQHDNRNPASTSDPSVDAGVDIGAEPTQTDLVAGDPPVPLTVWRTARTPADAGRSIGARLAARLVSAYSRPGEAVVDLSDGHALTLACAAGGRRHHPAWFTDASSLIIGPATPISSAETTSGTTADEDGEDLPELGAWFGDDLTDPGLPAGSTTDPVADLPPGGSLQQATSLVVACWPLDEGDAANRVRLAWLLTACARLLRPGGCLILVVAVPPGATTGPEDFSPVARAAAGVGLGYLQHIIAVAADISDDGDAFVYHVSDEELLTLVGATGARWQVAHLRVHADLLVFSQTQRRVAPRRAGREGGGRRG